LREFWRKHKGDIGLALLIVYTLSLGVAAADEIFHLQLFPTKLDRMIEDSIENLDSENPKSRQEARTNLLQYGEFAVPKLVGAVDREGQTGEAAMRLLQKITERKFESPSDWQDWYQKHQEDYM